MSDSEFARIVRLGMERAARGTVVLDPIRAPFPQLRAVWHVNANDPRGSTSKLVVNIFNGPTPFACAQEVLSNNAPPDMIEDTVETMTRQLLASQTNLRAGA